MPHLRVPFFDLRPYDNPPRQENMATILQIADGVTSELNTATLSQPIAAERHFVPNYDLKELGVLRVSVVPIELLIMAYDRVASKYSARIDVAVQKKFEQGTNQEIDPLIVLMEEIADLFRLKRLTQMQEARCVAVEHPVLYSAEHWTQNRLFTSLLSLSFQLAR